MPASERFGPTRRGGPVFRWLGEPLAIDLANTVMVVSGNDHEAAGADRDEVDLLASPGDLRRWLELERDRLGDCPADAAALERVRELRDAIRELLHAAAQGPDADGDATGLPGDRVALVNAVSAAAPVSPQLVADTDGLSRGELPEDGEPLTSLLGALARSAIDLLAGTPAGELRVCRAPSCGMLFLGKRRWCCSACGNRARAARHYRRHRGAAGAAAQRAAAQC